MCYDTGWYWLGDIGPELAALVHGGHAENSFTVSSGWLI